MLQVKDSEFQLIFLHHLAPLNLSCILHRQIFVGSSFKRAYKMDLETAVGHTCVSEKESCCTTEKLESGLCRLHVAFLDR
jgi:hypothetical protein